METIEKQTAAGVHDTLGGGRVKSSQSGSTQTGAVAE